MTHQELRQKYPEFTYKGFKYEVKDTDLVITFLFQVGADIEFLPAIIYKNIPIDRFSKIHKEVVDNFIFHLGLTEIPSYWKAFASPNIKIEAGFLDSEQINWWKDLYIKGMGQFYYENKIDFTAKDFITLTSSSSKKYLLGNSKNASGILVPVGGGKDSAVTLELLKNEADVSAFLVNPTKAAEDIVKASGIPKNIVTERALDPKLFDLNTKGFLNGHTPFSSVVAFQSVFAAYIFGISEVILSNERSSNEENTEYLGRKINHQYSKTLEFENKFRDYIGKYLTDVNYFSFLRPLYELQIAKLFSEMPKYFTLFRSCNIGQKTNSWCGNCSKCLSTYILLKPFLTSEQLTTIFGEDLLTKESLKTILSELIDDNKVKPFECVGTREELGAALNGKLNLLKTWNDDNNVPDTHEKLLRNQIQK